MIRQKCTSRYQSLICAIAFCGFSTGCNNSSDRAAEKPLVLSSVRPLQLLVNEITGGTVESVLVFKAQASPHDTNLGFADLRRLSQAELLVWLGPQFHSALPGALKGLAQPIRQIRLLSEQASSGFNDGENVDGYAAEVSAHLWLEPLKIVEILPQLTSELIAIQPSRGQQYRQAAKSLSAHLLELEREYRAALKPFTGSSVITGHGAVDDMLAHYGIESVGRLQAANHAGLSLKQLAKLRDQIDTGVVGCLVLELGEGGERDMRLFEGAKVNHAVVDVMGQNAKTFTELLGRVHGELQKCLRTAE